VTGALLTSLALQGCAPQGPPAADQLSATQLAQFANGTNFSFTNQLLDDSFGLLQNSAAAANQISVLINSVNAADQAVNQAIAAVQQIDQIDSTISTVISIVGLLGSLPSPVGPAIKVLGNGLKPLGDAIHPSRKAADRVRANVLDPLDTRLQTLAKDLTKAQNRTCLPFGNGSICTDAGIVWNTTGAVDSCLKRRPDLVSIGAAGCNTTDLAVNATNAFVSGLETIVGTVNQDLAQLTALGGAFRDLTKQLQGPLNTLAPLVDTLNQIQSAMNHKISIDFGLLGSLSFTVEDILNGLNKAGWIVDEFTQEAMKIVKPLLNVLNIPIPNIPQVQSVLDNMSALSSVYDTITPDLDALDSQLGNLKPQLTTFNATISQVRNLQVTICGS
jgi:hypothetical protein